jgi:NAD-dependent dihydropyrimidine dehydrogenase PreA subunit
MTYAISDECVDVMDRSCVAECPVDCIYEGGRRLYIQPNECIDCGACESVCPVEAISRQGYGGPDSSPDLMANLVFFTEPLPGRATPLGSPGAARDVGPLGVDPARVAQLPVVRPTDATAS